MNFSYFKNLAIALGLGIFSATGFAKDFGVQGQIFEIKEIDIRKLLYESVARAPLDQINKQREESAKKYLDNLKKRDMPVIDQSKLVWFDPSIELAEDIKSLVKNKAGEYEWIVVHKKGTRVNPMDTHRPSTQLLFFDARSEEQVAFVKAMLKKYPLTVYPMEASGMNPIKTMETIGRQSFYADDTFFSRYPITHLPTIIFSGKDMRKDFLGILSFSRPFNPDVVGPYIDVVGKGFATPTNPSDSKGAK